MRLWMLCSIACLLSCTPKVGIMPDGPKVYSAANTLRIDEMCRRDDSSVWCICVKNPTAKGCVDATASP